MSEHSLTSRFPRSRAPACSEAGFPRIEDGSDADPDQTRAMTQQVVRAPPGYEYVAPWRAVEHGEAYLATHLALRRQVVVVEIPRAAFVRPGATSRLRRDARSLVAPSTPSVVRILDLDVRGDPVRVITEHVPGRVLGDLLDVGPLRPDLALRVLDDVADALHAMASRRVVHGSVGAEHVVVPADGPARLGGFGVARALRDTDPDRRSDAHDFAWLAHRTLTGVPPPRSADDRLTRLPWRATEALLAGLADRPQERPLPRELVEVLRGIPAEDWSSARPPRVRVLPPGPPPSAPQRPDPPTPEREPGPRIRWSPGARPPRWFRWAVITLGLALTGGSAVIGAQMLEPWRMVSDTLEVQRVSVDVEPAAEGRCPRAEMRFVATVATNGRPGELTFTWTRPDGSRAVTERIEVAEGQDSVQTRAEFTFSGREAWSGRAVLRVGGADTRVAHRTVSYVCPPG